MTLSPPDAATARRLTSGEVLVEVTPVPGAKAPRISAQALIDAPPAQVWRVVDDSTRYPSFMPRVKSADELLRDGNTLRVRVTVKMPFPLKDMVATTDVVNTVEPDVPHYRRQWRLREGAYTKNEGAWDLVAWPDDPQRTWIRYHVHVVPKMPIPKRLQAGLQQKAMPSLFSAVRDEVRRRR